MSELPESHFEFTAPATSSGLVSCREAMECSALYQNLPERLRFVADLALDELATNTIKYGAQDEAPFDFTLRYASGTLQIEYKDQGVAFDPWAHAAKKSATLAVADVDDLDPEIGGRGLIMMQEMSATRNYERRDESNVITLSVIDNADT
jgi:anti-sigma regulatory factor (Ser/Thr protein kinase)